MLPDRLYSTFILQSILFALSFFGLKCKADLGVRKSHHHVLPRGTLIERETPSTPSCGYWATADANTTCAEILRTYNLEASDFLALNPRNGVYHVPAYMNSTNCGGVVSFNTYCVAPGVQNKISSDGQCGPKSGNAVCPGSSFGNCCSVSGWCGNGYDFCGIGNCIGGNCVNGTGWSTDGRCGIEPLQPKCGGKFGVCCSITGWCGNSTDHCAWDNCASGACVPPAYTSATVTKTAAPQCQAGSCWTSLPPTGPVAGSTISVTTSKSSSTSGSSSRTASTRTSSTPAATPISLDSTCGGSGGYTCAGSTFGNCCSSSGYCGKTGVFCGEGCQTKWSSSCQTSNISSNNGRCGVISGSPTFTCVGGQYDNACCSAAGYCGTTSGHCGSGCQSKYGRCN